MDNLLFDERGRFVQDGFAAARPISSLLPGTEGRSVADVFGGPSFTGTLPQTWSRSVEQLSLVALEGSDKEPLFPFGYGSP
jgi:hypothetical protein